MKKQFIILLILVFVFGLAPVNFSLAITQNQINSEVQIVCTDGSDNWFSGSGTIIDPKGIILTNKHVVEGAYNNICFIGFLESINQEPNFGSKDNPNLAEVKYITTTKDMDAAVLYLDNPNNKIYPYVNIWNSNSDNLKFGDKIEVVGYPVIGGSTITYTSGDFSGFGSQSDGTQNYIKTTALLEHGNSGGSAYNQRGEFVGIPSMVVTGSLNSISFVLSVDSIKTWLSGFLGSGYKQEVIEQKPIIIEQPKVNLKDDISPPNIDLITGDFRYNGYDDKFNDLGYAGSANKNQFKSSKYKNVKFSLPVYTDLNNDFISQMDLESGVSSILYSYSKDLSALINSQEKEIIIEKKYENWGYYINVTDVISLPEEGAYYVSLKFKDKAGNISNNYILTYVYEKEYYKGIKNIKFYKDKEYKNIIADYDYNLSNSSDNYKYCVTKYKDVYFEWSFDQNYAYIVKDFPTDMTGLIRSDKNSKNYIKTETNKYAVHNLNLSKENNEYFGTNICENENDKNCHVIGKVTSFLLKPIINKTDDLFLEGKNTIIKFAYNPNISSDIICGDPDKSKLNNFNNPLIILKSGNSIENGVLASKLKGKILLQIESHGEAWYINPKDGKRYYMANGDKAYGVMINFGIGITNKDLEKIKTNKIFAKNISGKIFLQVEAKGEAYYIDFNGVAHYLKNGTAAYEVMRSLGLGITNADIGKIGVGEIK